MKALSDRTTQFAYFDRQLNQPDWRGRKIMDFGGNVAGFLEGAGDSVRQEDYWCVEINEIAIEKGRRRFPGAHFIDYNRYCSEYRPDGIRNLPIPDCGIAFDLIVSFSVFTHIHLPDMLDLISQLRSMLKPDGMFGFTFTDPGYDRSLGDPGLPPGTDVAKMLQNHLAKRPELEVEQMARKAGLSKWCLVIDHQLYIEPGEEFSNRCHQGSPGESFCSYFAADHIRSIYPEGKVLEPVYPEWQHCCLLGPESNSAT